MLNANSNHASVWDLTYFSVFFSLHYNQKKLPWKWRDRGIGKVPKKHRVLFEWPLRETQPIFKLHLLFINTLICIHIACELGQSN